MIKSFPHKNNLNSHNQVFLLLILAFVFSASFTLKAQERKPITLTDIWASRDYVQDQAENINFMADSRYYVQLDDTPDGNIQVNKLEVKTGKKVSTLFDLNTSLFDGAKPIGITDFELNTTEDFILFRTNVTPIYRRSSTADYFIYNLKTKKGKKLSNNGAQGYATLSPDGKKIAYVRANNLFVNDLATSQEIAVTSDGAPNKIINGSCDWVYEEEFEFAQAFSWNANGAYLAYYRFDETLVPEYNMQLWSGLYPKDYLYKYPKAGQPNSKVAIKVYTIADGKTKNVDLGPDQDQYIPRINWGSLDNTLSIRRLNRLQNTLDVLHYNTTTDKTTIVYTEINTRYLEVNDDLRYLDKSDNFIYTSEKNGYRHLYQVNTTTGTARQITTGNHDIIGFCGLDAKTKTLYYTSTQTGYNQKQLYSISLDGKNEKALTTIKGQHDITFSPDFSLYIDNYSNINSPGVSTLFTSAGKKVKSLSDNSALETKLQNAAVSKAEFINFNTAEGTNLNGFIIKPLDFSASKKYPILMYCYGGPGHQEVTDEWKGANFLWYQMLAQQGYIIVCVDGRGTGGRGEDFKKTTYKQLGKYESLDQIAAAKYLTTLPYVDPTRIGIWGWSFGGYNTALCMTKGDGTFKMGISVAPVTNWRYYDSIYTERFLQTPDQNPEGYDQNSPVKFAAGLKGKFLLVHGTGDDNVHLQNAIEMEQALIKANKQFDLMYYPNRNHGIYGGSTRLHLYTLMTNYIKANL